MQHAMSCSKPGVNTTPVQAAEIHVCNRSGTDVFRDPEPGKGKTDTKPWSFWPHYGNIVVASPSSGLFVRIETLVPRYWRLRSHDVLLKPG